MPENKLVTVTVTQLNRKISFMLSGEKALADLCVKGEISNLSINAKSGHIFFTLKDENSAVKAVMFSNNAHKLTFRPENGMAVTVRGSVRCFERDGVYQIYVAEMKETGAGALSAEFERLKSKLEAQGMFSRKRPLPQMPGKICVITSETGAVLQDIRNVLSRRCPQVQVLLIPAVVQGEDAPASIAEAIAKANETDSELIIFGRGGGSAEDLSCFNSEVTARAIFDSRIPTISAVGHETDFTIADFTADMRAPTPSAAAELAVPDNAEVLRGLTAKRDAIGQMLYRVLDTKVLAVRSVSSDIRAKSPINRIRADEQRLAAVSDGIRVKMSSVLGRYERGVYDLSGTIKAKAHNAMDMKERAFIGTAALIEALNPLAVLLRGYSITYLDDKAVASADEVEPGDKIRIRLAEGTITAAVENKDK